MGFFKVLKTCVKVGYTTTKVVGGATVGIVRGVAGTLEDTSKVLQAATEKDWNKVEKIAGKRIEMTINGFEARVKAACDLGDEALNCLQDPKRPFLTDENTKRMTKLATIGLVSVAGLSVIDDVEADETDDSSGNDSYDSYHGIDGIPTEHGMFVGDQSDLENLAAKGRIEGTYHIDSEDIERDISARNEFLRMNGYDSVPEGYEVHHIHPLSQGGADNPDNMILLKTEDHDFVTAAHSRFYGWHA